MGTGTTVAVVESDEWVARLLDGALREAGYEVWIAGEALAGVHETTERKPDCVVCASRLPDFDGAWVVSQIRASTSRVSETPFLLLSTGDGDDALEPAFRAGADAAMSKPFRVREVVAQVNALVGMATRLRRSSERDSPPLLSLRPSLFPTEALRGSLAQMSLAMVLALLEMERRSGRVRISRDGSEAAIEIASGFATGASIEGKPTPLVPALRQLLAWRSGVVSFVVGSKLPPPPGAQPMAALLMQAMQAPSPPIPKPPRLPSIAPSQDTARPRHRPPAHRPMTLGMMPPPPMSPPRLQPK
jgi:two-component system OmpR family response regulator